MSERLARVLSTPPQGETRLITYLVAGDPSPEATLRRIKGLAREVDIIELGVPFSDPIADGPVIQVAAQRALAGKMTVRKTLNLVREFRLSHDTPVLLMSYLNPLLRYGWDEFVRDCVTAGVDGLILPDLPWRQGEGLRKRTRELVGKSLVFIPMVAQTSEAQDIEALAEVDQGFVYVLARNGITGGETVLPPEAKSFIAGLRQTLNVPYCVGFGIQKPQQVKTLQAICDGVIVGSALVERFAALDRAGLNPEELMRQEQNVCHWVSELKRSPELIPADS